MRAFDRLAELTSALARTETLAELGVLALCLGVAYAVVRLTRRDVGRSAEVDGGAHGGVWYGDRGFDGALFPLLALGLAIAARWAFAGQLPLAVFTIAIPVLASLALIRVTVRVLHVAFPTSRVVRVLERTVSWVVWIGLVLWLTGLLPLLLADLDKMRWSVAGTDITMRGLAEGALSAVVVMVLVLWLSASIEARLMSAAGINVSVRKMAANTVRALLLIVGVLVALSAIGIPLGALSVLGGAIGVGIGLGLQKLAANYVSGFVILAERSLRIGDIVKVDNFEGRVTDISMRYTVIRALNGREAIVPNEMLTTQRVENCTYADTKVALTTVVQVAYGTDLWTLMPRLQSAVREVPRVLPDPLPSLQLSKFAADGLELTIVCWIADPQNGQGNVLSEINLALMKALNAAGVEIPFPQQVIHTRAGTAPAEFAAPPSPAAPGAR